VKPDTKAGAVAVINATGDYGEWAVESCEFVADPQVSGVWLVADRKKGFAVLVSTINGEVTDDGVELECFDRNKAKHS
jgi:hypothetical protein